MKLQTPHVPLDGFNLLWEKKRRKTVHEGMCQRLTNNCRKKDFNVQTMTYNKDSFAAQSHLHQLLTTSPSLIRLSSTSFCKLFFFSIFNCLYIKDLSETKDTFLSTHLVKIVQHPLKKDRHNYTVSTVTQYRLQRQLLPSNITEGGKWLKAEQ